MNYNLIYDKYNVYISSYHPYTRQTTETTRPTTIHWPTNIDKIVELSKLNKNIEINLSNTIRKKKNKEEKKETVSTTLTIEPLSELRQDIIRDFSDHISPTTIINPTDRFWALIRRVLWYDKDERRLTRDDLRRYINISGDVRFILERMDNVFIPELTRAVSDIPLLQSIEQENHKNILAHIIFKGLDFYNGIIDNPEVSLYLCDQYYPVYDWLRSYIFNEDLHTIYLI